MDYATHNKPIHAWAAEDRPREKMETRGKGALSDAEIVATLLATGTRELSAIELGRAIIDHFGGLPNLSRATIADLIQIRGVGKAKATTIVAAFELANRRMAIEHQALRFDCSKNIAHYLMPKIGNLPQEVFVLLYLDRQNQLLGESEVFKGGISNVSVDSQYLFKLAISNQASAIVVCHNHPSGRTTPSASDDELTQHLVSVSQVVGVPLLDHLIVTHKTWYSYADLGIIEVMKSKCRGLFDAVGLLPGPGRKWVS